MIRDRMTLQGACEKKGREKAGVEIVTFEKAREERKRQVENDFLCACQSLARTLHTSRPPEKGGQTSHIVIYSGRGFGRTGGTRPVRR
jgi:hypothetical protein